MPHCYFVNDYKQAHQDIVEEEAAGALPTRASAGLPDDKIIYACSNQVRARGLTQLGVCRRHVGQAACCALQAGREAYGFPSAWAPALPSSLAQAVVSVLSYTTWGPLSLALAVV